ncbi:Maf family nucleotide pyrophosphatase [Zunongwangia sp. F363]|uniref:dTTP/UTP pyrophosphatase n=1 Tax=Autumnicola tepida TaxID=3075595 RepID=A0ABU3CDQ8_9FLAO|nr:Maf family nucleotide pyrophosphatase [Zunongwangia sp. F363]MDT0644479.1 Maf family nucleotide pyrophosphatase [Zunongwangia sp. F363]
MLKDYLKNKEVILASGSPRRQRFFKEMEIPYTVDVRPVKEVFPDHLKDEEITDFLAQLKAEAFENLESNQILITSDTIVLNDGVAMGKPADAAEAVGMIESLSGKTHQVITSVCFTTAQKQETIHSTTRVSFRELTSEEIVFYVRNYKPFDKAGGYAIQEWIGLVGITGIEGSYFNVVGLPTHLVYNKLIEFAKS